MANQVTTIDDVPLPEQKDGPRPHRFTEDDDTSMEVIKKVHKEKAPITNIDEILNINPEGCNQHTGPGCSGSGTPDSIGKWIGKLKEGTHSPSEVQSAVKEKLAKLSKSDVEKIVRDSGYTPSGSKKDMVERLSSNLGALQMSKTRGELIKSGQAPKYESLPELEEDTTTNTEDIDTLFNELGIKQ